MHYVTFVAVDIGDYPIYKDTDGRIKAEIAKLLKNKKDSTQKDVFAECRLSELKSLTNSFARAVNSAVEYRLEPYCECTEDEEYLEFIDETEDARKQYESGVDCIKLPDGKIVMAYTLSDRFCIKDGLVYQKKFGQLKQDKRSKKAKRMIALSNYPFKKLYKSFEEFAEQYRGMNFDEEQNAYGYYCNPNSFWDWYRIGGRWPCNFLVKEECEEYSPGNYDDELPTPPNGYKWASAARKKDIQWQALIEYEKKRMLERFEFYRRVFETKVLPDDEWGLKIKEDGIYSYFQNIALYLDGETFEENQTRREFIDDSDYLTLPCYYVDEETWYSDCSPKEHGEWKEEIKHFYAKHKDKQSMGVSCYNGHCRRRIRL